MRIPRIALVAGIAAGAAAAGAAQGTILVANDASRWSLGVDAKGTAVVRVIAAGRPDTIVVPARGQLFHGGALSGPDVSKRIRIPGLALAVETRRTPDGTLWALQAWRVLPGLPVELHLARWQGAPTKLELQTDGTRISGRATFQGKPVAGRTFTLEGKRPRIYVYLDCLACGGKPGWTRMIGVAPRADGSFRALLRPSWKGRRYRATVAGPNTGTTFAPDAQVEIPAPG